MSTDRLRLRIKAAYYVLTGRGTVVFNAYIIAEGVTIAEQKDRHGRTLPRLIVDNFEYGPGGDAAVSLPGSMGKPGYLGATRWKR